jgi:tetratricopeptide (TPR) repeat protein
MGWLWYLVTLIPVVGLVQVGEQSFADRYTYVPFIGLFIIITWSASELFVKWPHKKIIFAVLSSAILLTLSICTWFQVGHWRNSLTLFEHALEVTSGNYLAHNNLGLVLQSQGKLDESVIHYRQAIKDKPAYTKAYNNLGNVLLSQGKFDEALWIYEEALQIDPDFTEAHYNLSNALKASGKPDEAIRHYYEAVKIRPDFADAHYNLGNVFKSQGRFTEAEKHYRKALEIKADDAEAHNNLGIILKAQGKLEEAIFHYRKALEIKPDYAKAHNNLASAYQAQGNFEEAADHYSKALRIQSDNPEIMSNLAILLANHPESQKQDRVEAIKLAEQAAELTMFQNPTILSNLSAVYAYAGRFENAIDIAKKALALPSTANDDALFNHISKQLEQYEQSKP